MIAATFSLTSGDQPMIDEVSLVPTSGQWIPADDAFELRLVNCLVRESRSFRKSLQLNSKVPSLYPSAILLDVKAAPIGLALDRDSGYGVDASTVSEWTYPDLTDTLGLDLHFAAEVNSAVAGMAALALLCISFSKLMGDF